MTNADDDLLMRATEQSRLVRGYVKAVRRHLDLKARLAAHDERLRPLRNKVAVASETVKRKYGRLNGGQIAAAERLLRETPLCAACRAAGFGECHGPHVKETA